MADNMRCQGKEKIHNIKNFCSTGTYKISLYLVFKTTGSAAENNNP